MAKKNLEKTVGKLLSKRKKTLAIAEGITGGLISHRITNIPGAGQYFVMGTVPYQDKMASKELKIPFSLIRKCGPTSPEVVVSMADGIRKLAKSDIGVGIGGLAGPVKGSKINPVGLTYVALVKGGKIDCRKFRFKGSREAIKMRASDAALNMIKESLGG